MYRLLLSLIIIIGISVAGCATRSATAPDESMTINTQIQAQTQKEARPPGTWFLTIRTVTGPYDTEAACAAAARSARATIETRTDQAGKPWTFVCDTQAR